MEYRVPPSELLLDRESEKTLRRLLKKTMGFINYLDEEEVALLDELLKILPEK